MGALSTLAKVIAVVAVLAKLGVFKAFFEMRRRRALMLKLPGPPVSHWFKGNMLDLCVAKLKDGEERTIANLRNHMIGLMRDLNEGEENKDAGMIMSWKLSPRLQIHSQGRLILTDMDLCRELLAAKTMPSLVKGHSYVCSTPLIGEGVLSASGSKWRKQRPIIERGFRPKLLQNQVRQAVKTAEELILKWKLKLSAADCERGVDVHEEMLKVTMDILGRVGFSYDFGSVTAATTAEAPLWTAFDRILKGLSLRTAVPGMHETRWLPTKHNRRLNASLKKLGDVVDDIIQQRLDKKNPARREMKDPVLRRSRSVGNEGDGGDEHGDVLDTLLAGGHGADGKLSFQEIRDNINTLLFAGHDTTAAALSWILYVFAAKRPDAAKRCREEIAAQCGAHGDPTYDSLESMPFLNACVKEILRLYPSAGFTRGLLEDTVLGGRLIPAKTEIVVFPWLVQRNPKYYDRPDDFVPERWLEGEAPEVDAAQRAASAASLKSWPKGLQAQFGLESKTKPYLPFSLGPRNCVGRPMALMQIRVVLVKLLQHFDMELPPTPDPNYQDNPVVSLTLNPRSIRLVPRVRFQ